MTSLNYLMKLYFEKKRVDWMKFLMPLYDELQLFKSINSSCNRPNNKCNK